MIFQIVITVVVVLLVVIVERLTSRVRKIHKHLIQERKRKQMEFEVDCLEGMSEDIEELLKRFEVTTDKDANKKPREKTTRRKNGTAKHETKKGPKKVRKSKS